MPSYDLIKVFTYIGHYYLQRNFVYTVNKMMNSTLSTLQQQIVIECSDIPHVNTLTKNMFTGNTYSNIADSSSTDGTDKCYYNFDDHKRKPATAITVEELPDVALQPKFRRELHEQFNVRCFSPKDVCL